MHAIEGVHLTSSKGNFCIFPHTSVYAPLSCEAVNRELYSEVYSMSLLQGTEHTFGFKFIICRELVLTVNIPVQKRNTTCRIIASVGSLTR